MDKVKQASFEQDLIDWVVFSGGSTLGGAARATGLTRSEAKPLLEALVGKGTLRAGRSVRGGFAREYRFNQKSGPVGNVCRLYPAVCVEDDHMRYKTSVDALAAAVNRYGLVDAGMAARFFKTSEERVEDWGKILSEQCMLEVAYPVFGGTVFVRKGLVKPFIVWRRLFEIVALLALAALAYARFKV